MPLIKAVPIGKVQLYNYDETIVSGAWKTGYYYKTV